MLEPKSEGCGVEVLDANGRPNLGYPRHPWHLIVNEASTNQEAGDLIGSLAIMVGQISRTPEPIDQQSCRLSVSWLTCDGPRQTTGETLRNETVEAFSTLRDGVIPLVLIMF